VYLIQLMTYCVTGFRYQNFKKTEPFYGKNGWVYQCFNASKKFTKALTATVNDTEQKELLEKIMKYSEDTLTTLGAKKLLEGYSFVLMSDKPQQLEFEKGKLYLKLENNTIHYKVLKYGPDNEVIEGRITQEDFNKRHGQEYRIPSNNQLSLFEQIKEGILGITSNRRHTLSKEMLKNFLDRKWALSLPALTENVRVFNKIKAEDAEAWDEFRNSSVAFCFRLSRAFIIFSGITSVMPFVALGLLSFLAPKYSSSDPLLTYFLYLLSGSSLLCCATTTLLVTGTCTPKALVDMYIDAKPQANNLVQQHASLVDRAAELLKQLGTFKDTIAKSSYGSSASSDDIPNTITENPISPRFVIQPI